ncbi:uncharacterized protein [Palaemon carinicauda]|uniref:uncharacterized protein n=1 Tax=Palaemon carinicauda TaxID=392227 RepID=UPI0035B58E34
MDGSPRPQTLQFLLEMDDGNLYHATYKDVMIDTSGAITSAGEYMGNAGDSFTPNMQWTWDATLQWFADSATPAGASFFGEPDSPLWPTLVGLTIQTATIRMRPSSFDTKTSCPPMIGVFDPSWLTDRTMLSVSGEALLSRSEISISVPLSRAEGANVTYACNGPFYKEPVSGNTEGIIYCIPGADPNTFQWGSEITLPCQGSCPTDFNMALDKASCYYFSDLPEPHGVVGAAMR